LKSSSSSTESPSSSAWTTSTSTSASASTSETHCLIIIVFSMFFDTLGDDAITQERVVSNRSSSSLLLQELASKRQNPGDFFHQKSMIRIGPSSVVGSWNNNAHNLMRLMTQPLLSETGSDSIHSSFSFRFFSTMKLQLLAPICSPASTTLQ
jgi:hypothetical protein